MLRPRTEGYLSLRLSGILPFSERPGRLDVRDRAYRSWWRGLDSNQRTLARADLQSAAFNHSATSPRGHAGCMGRRAMWRDLHYVSTQVGAKSCRPSATLRALRISAVPRLQKFGAGEGNRTLVVSLEGFCSTIELHPLVTVFVRFCAGSRSVFQPWNAGTFQNG